MGQAEQGTVHGTVVALDGAGVLLRGDAGVGKSDLALRLLAEGWTLIADDRVALDAVGGRLVARCPDALRGMLEVRGYGIVRLTTGEWMSMATLHLAVDLTDQADAIPRMPEARFFRHSGIECPAMQLYPFQASAGARLRLALSVLSEPGKRVE